MSLTALNTPVLVLNRNYAAVHMVTCRRALSLLYRDCAEVVHVKEESFANHGFEEWVIQSAGRFPGASAADKERDDWIFTITYPVRVPKIIRLLRYDRYPRRRVSLTRRNVFARDEHTCQYCRVRKPMSELTIDHVIPRSRGGRESWENIVTACPRCNHKKGQRTVEEAGLKLLKTPRAPKLNPVLQLNLQNQKFASWRKFV